MKKEELFKLYADDSELTAYHYKVLLLLLSGERTQAEMASELNTTKQYINRICKDLSSIGYITVGAINGRNKYLKINFNPNVQIKGQIGLEDL